MKKRLLFALCVAIHLFCAQRVEAAPPPCPPDACIHREQQVGPKASIHRDWDQDLVNGVRWVSRQLRAFVAWTKSLFTANPSRSFGRFEPFATAYANYVDFVESALHQAGFPSIGDFRNAMERDMQLRLQMQAWLSRQPAWRFEHGRDGLETLFMPVNATRDQMDRYYHKLDQAAHLTQQLQEELKQQQVAYSRRAFDQGKAFDASLSLGQQAVSNLEHQLAADHALLASEISDVLATAKPSTHQSTAPHLPNLPDSTNALPQMTPPGHPGYRQLVQSRRHYNAAVAFTETAPADRKERSGLLAIADLSLKAADHRFAAGDDRIGHTLLEASDSLLDAVFDFAHSAIRDAMHTKAAAIVAGFLHGALGMPLDSVPGNERFFGLGQVIGSTAGLLGDAAVITAAVAGTIGSGFVVAATGGVALPLAVGAAALAEAAVAGGAFVLATEHGQKFSEGLQYIQSSRASGASKRSRGFRSKMIKATGRDPKGYHAHHVFPVKFWKLFKRLGINISDPRYGVWWKARDHLQHAIPYNAAWHRFFEEAFSPRTMSEALEFGRYLIKKYGFSPRF